MSAQKIWELKLWKEKPVCLFTALFFLYMVFCAVMAVRPCQEHLFEGSFSFGAESGPGVTTVYGGICLRPGVYRVELEYSTDTDVAGVCSASDGTVFAGGLLTNGEHMYVGLDRTGYELWLYEGTENLQITVNYVGRGSITTGNLRIVETRKLWTMLLAAGAALGAGVYLLLIYRCYNRRFPVSREKKQVFFFVTAICLAASIPYLCGYNITGADLTYHLQRIEGVKDGLLAGQFPVRLEPRWVFDHWYANAIFYCNTFLYFPALLRMLGFPVVTSYNLYCLALNAATAWISYYCFSRIFRDRSIGILCSALYTLSIFRIYKLLVTSAVGEGTAVTFLPLVLYGMYKIYEEEDGYRRGWVPVTLGMCGLIQSHVLTCEITAGVMILFCLFHLRKTFRRNTFLALVKAAVSTALVCLWFLVPFLDYYLTQDVHIKHVSGRTIQDRGLYPAHLAFHFWKTGSSTPGMGNGMQYSHPVGIGLVLMLALGVFLALWFGGAFRAGGRAVAFVKRTAAVGVLLLFMSLDIFPWDRIQALNSVTASLVSSLQFPNRFLGWGTGCLVLVFGFCLWYFKGRDRRHYLTMGALALAGVVTSGMYLLDYVNAGQEYYKIYNEEGMGFGYISGAEYLIEGTELGKLTFARPAAGPGAEITGYEKRGYRTLLQCENSAGEESYVDIPTLYYKGYQAVDTGTGQEVEICPGENNVVRVTVPSGFAGTVEVDFVSPFYWRAAEAVSLLGTVCLGAAVWIMWRKRSKALESVCEGGGEAG